jgi:hypothetical protein
MTVPVVVYRPRGEGPRNNPLGTNFAWRAARDDAPSRQNKPIELSFFDA